MADAGGGLGGGGGQTNTASNVGTGDGWFKQKVGSDLEFKTCIGETGKCIITSNPDDLTITLGVDVVLTDRANAYGAGQKQTFIHSATTAGIRINEFAGNPSTLVDGDIWLNLTSNQLFARINGANVDLGAAGGGGEANTISSLGGGTALTAAVPKSGVDLRTVSVATTLPLTHSVSTDLLTFDINDLVDADIGAHTSTKITITAKGQLNASIVYEDESNSYAVGTKQTLAASAAGGAGARLLTGADPTVPVQGDLWLVGDDLKIRGATTTRVLVDTARAQTLSTKTLDSTCVIQSGAYDTASVNLTTDVTGLLPNGNLANLPALGTLPASPRTTNVNLATEVTGLLPNGNLANLPVLGTLPASPRQTAILTAEISDNQITNPKIGAHTSTKITITAKGQLNASIVYEDEANTWGAFNQNIATGGKWQEAGKNISPIGLHDIPIMAGSFDEVTASAIATRIVDAGDDRKVLRYISYLNGANQFATVMFQLPRNYNNGTITAVLHWTTQVEGAGNVIWGLAAAALGDGQDYSTVVYGTEITVTDAQATIDQEQLSPRTAAITIGNTPADNKMIVLRVQRRGGDGGDTFTQPAQFLGVTIEITLDEAVAP